MENKIELTILIPAFNEETTIEIVIQKAKKWIEQNKIKSEVLVVNNNSVDKTKEYAIKNGVRVIDVLERGYGNAIISGIKEAKGKNIIMGDADDSYDFLEITDFYNELEKGYDLVIGNRFYKIEKGAMKWSHQYIGTPLLSYIFSKKYNLKINDINCGLRSFKKEKIRELNLTASGMELASEMLIKAAKQNLKIKETPIRFYKDKRNKKSHLRTVRDGFRHLRILLGAKAE